MIALRLTTMADAFSIQSGDPKMQDIPFEDRVAMLIDAEYTSRKSNRLKRLIHDAEFEQPEAHIADSNDTSGRKLNKELILRLASGEYITEYRNIFITGKTGSGKSYLACALGMEACKQYYKTYFIRLPDLLMELDTARENGDYLKVLMKYAKVTLLIIDEWLMLKPTQEEQKDIFELIHRRRKKSSTIFCSQVHWDGWYEQLGGDASPLADAILDRIIYDAYRIHIQSIDPKNDKSMREVYGLDKQLRE